jgi:glycosyltransferase EpsF
MKVLMLINWLNRGGIETWLVDLLRYVDRSRIIMDIACKGTDTGEMTPMALEAGSKVYHAPLRFNPWSFKSKLREILVNGNYDIFHSHAGIMSSEAIAAAESAGVRCKIVSFHNTQIGGMLWARDRALTSLMREMIIRRNKNQINRAMKRDDCYTWYFSKSMREKHRAWLRLPDSRQEVMYYGIDVESVAPKKSKTIRHQYNLDDDCLVIGHVGSFSRGNQKNHDAIINAAGRLKSEGMKFKVILVGDGEQRQRIAELAGENNLSSDIIFTGIRNDVNDLLHDMDIFVFPSFHEGLSVALLEAQAASLPVLASDIPENKEGLWEGMWEYCYHPDDYNKLAGEIMRLEGSPGLRRELGDRSRRFVKENFDRGKCVSRMTAKYEQYLDRTGK